MVQNVKGNDLLVPMKNKQKQSKGAGLSSYLTEGNIAFFGFHGKTLPEFVHKKKTGRVRVFSKKKRDCDFSELSYSSLLEIREERSDVYFLDHEATKVLFVDFPATAQYVLVRFIPRWGWFVAIPGLVRRLIIGLVKIRGIKKIKVAGSDQHWLVIEHILTESLHTRLSLSYDMGVGGFLSFLKESRVAYVVLRFFEKLPNLYREGGDLDILVSDEDEKTIKGFLQKNPGPLGVDVWTVSRTTYNDITYYPPPLARKIIQNAIDGPASSRIPNPKHAFLALAYHVVYHKGLFAGVPTKITGLDVNENPENDYAGVLRTMADDLNIKIEITMEGLDEYLHVHGWRPKLDTLAKIAPKNKWVWKHFFSNTETKEFGLGVFVLKQKTIELGVLDQVLNVISNYEGFSILHIKKLKKDEIEHVTNNLRGGVWGGKTNTLGYLPAVVVVVLDTNLAHLSQVGKIPHTHKKGIKALKKMLRKMFDVPGGSIVHATDTTHESLEYLDVCFPDELKEINLEIKDFLTKLKPSFLESLYLQIVHSPRLVVYHFVRLKEQVKKRLIRSVMKI